MAIITALKIALAPNVTVVNLQVPVTVFVAFTPYTQPVEHSVQLFIGPTYFEHPVGLALLHLAPSNQYVLPDSHAVQLSNFVLSVAAVVATQVLHPAVAVVAHEFATHAPVVSALKAVLHLVHLEADEHSSQFVAVHLVHAPAGLPYVPALQATHLFVVVSNPYCPSHLEQTLAAHSEHPGPAPVVASAHVFTAHLSATTFYPATHLVHTVFDEHSTHFPAVGSNWALHLTHVALSVDTISEETLHITHFLVVASNA